MLATMMFLAACAVVNPAKPPAPVHGVFVELNGQYDWYRAVSNLKGRKIIIANIHGYGDAPCEAPTGCSKIDEALELLRKVPARSVYVGVVYQKNFKASEVDETALAAARLDDYKRAKAFWKAAKSAGLQDRVAGWYLGREWHNVDDDTQQARLHDYVDGISADLKKLSGHDSVVAPFFRPQTCSKVGDPAATATMFVEIVRDSDVTLLLLQDGFGVQHMYECTAKLTLDEYRKNASAYALAVRDALKVLKKPEVAFGVDLEAFGPLGKDQCRLRAQFDAVPPNTPVFIYSHRDCLVTGLCQ